MLRVFCLLFSISGCFALLYPRESESRELKDLSGKWHFRIDDSGDRIQGFRERWWEKPLRDSGPVIDIPVPASYNDVTQNSSIRDFIGWAWYQTTFYVPASWKTAGHVILRIGSAHYNAMVYLNGNEIVDHSGGHLPFEVVVSHDLVYGGINTLTIAVNNTLTPHTLPPGVIRHYHTEDGYPSGYFTQEYEFDFFNYAGIHRPVKLYTVPSVYISDIKTTFEINPDMIHSQVHYNIITAGNAGPSDLKESNDIKVTVNVKSKAGELVGTSNELNGTINLSNRPLWWPVGMNDTFGYLHTLEVHLTASDTDIYRLPIGIRTVKVDGTSFLINGKPFYFHGFGRHEDWNVRGKGLDWSMVIKDFNMIDWLGGNSFRTSHYPYAEEIMQMCDERGIVVIDECPAVGMRTADNFVNITLQHHLAVMKELVSRDYNHPSVVMWSVANEPASNLPQTADYFKTVLDYTRSLDPTRPVTFVCNEHYDKDVATPFVDVVSINIYEGWYTDSGHTAVVQDRLEAYIKNWHQTRPHKPIIHMEWGAGVISGFHSNPTVMWTESYLVDLMSKHFAVFDDLRAAQSPYFVGEMIWNFADFMTAQTNTRVFGNRKGVLTRDRQPKWPAYVLRERYHALLNQTIPEPFKNSAEKLRFIN